MRDWWLRTVLVLVAPRPVFVALRDESDESASDRAEPVLAIVLLAGMTLALASHASRGYDSLDLAVWTFVAGGITGTFAYWFFGAVLYWAGRALGSQGTYRRARNVLAFAFVPLAVCLVLAPVGSHRFSYVAFVFLAWSAGLLLVGVRAVHGWSWSRAFAATLAPVAVAVALVAV
jgi:Yip1 domain